MKEEKIVSEGELGKRIKQKILDGEGKVSFSFGIKPILEECLHELLRGQPDLSPQTLRWLDYEFGTTYLAEKEVVNPLGWNKSNHGSGKE
jgi:hypothetical protein